MSYDAVHKLTKSSGAMTVDMVPQLIETGYRAIAVQFDVWGVARLMASSLEEARGFAQKYQGVANGTAKDIPNGSAKPQ